MTQGNDNSNIPPEESTSIEPQKPSLTQFESVDPAKPPLPKGTTTSVKDQTRAKLATDLLELSKWIVIGIAALVAVDLVVSKYIAWRLIEKLAEPTAPISSPQPTSSPTAATPAAPSPNNSDKAAEAAQKLIVYKDLLKEASLNKELLTLLLTSQTALVSGALGFYFGGKDND
jgi:hypothetical protein